VGGQVAAVEVAIGDAVRAGDVIARLDAAQLDLRALQAEAAVARLEAMRGEKRRAVETQRELLDRNAAARRTVEGAAAELAVAEAELAEAQAGLALARRDRDDALLRAPFDGRVAAREVEPNAEVAPGDVVARIDGAALEVLANVPASIQPALRTGASAAVDVLGARLAGVVAHVGQRAGAGLTVPVVIALGPDAEAVARPGMVAEVTVPLGAETCLIAPLAAVVPEGPDGAASVFVLAPEGGRVARRAVTVARIADAGAVIAAGLAPGERIVAAGAAFLTDGQTVRPLD
jgi:RND family efflux transporter MFP subunit